MNALHRLFGGKEKSTVNTCCSENEFREKLKIERSRTHRNSHEFTIILFKVEPMQVSKAKINRIIENIHSRIRDIDNFGWYDKQNLGIILPYTSSRGAKKFAKHIIDSNNDFQKQLSYTLITYPPEKKKAVKKPDKSILRSV